MKVLVITGSRADRNCVEPVHEALLKAGHESQTYFYDGMLRKTDADVAIVGGDRIEILEAAVELASLRIPIAHIAGGDITEGSADDRYRDAITALSCIHFATNAWAYDRLNQMGHNGDLVLHTGSPAIDRIKQTKVLDKIFTLNHFSLQPDLPTALVCVHPETIGDLLATFAVVRDWLFTSDMQAIVLGANADPGGEVINKVWSDLCSKSRRFYDNVSPQLYYSLMTHCDIMVGNSSAMLHEAPSFGLPCVLIGDRQNGRMIPGNVCNALARPYRVEKAIKMQLANGRVQCINPYGDGNSAPRIVKALEEHFK